MSEILGTRVLVVEGRRDARALLASIVADEGFIVHTVSRGDDALQALDRESFDVVLVDLSLDGLGGLGVIAAAPALRGDARFVAIDRAGDARTAVEAMRLGAFHVLEPPLRAGEVAAAVHEAALEVAERRAAAPAPDESRRGARARLVGRSPAMERLFGLVERVAPTRATVLVTGETGTGKELVARAIHALSGRGSRPFVAINCGALPESLLESELFGHMKGSFTGAVGSRAGLVETAAGGTLFLDEISASSPALQVKLLRVLQERSVVRVGGNHPIAVDFRLIAATNLDLGAEVAAGRFREDLFYRLSVFLIEVPALRDRREDIPLLAEHFRRAAAKECGLDAPPFARMALRRMAEYDWPGNVRELENAVERAVIMHTGARVLPFEPPARPTAALRPPLRARATRGTLDALEREHVLRVLDEAQGNRRRAAAALGIDRSTLHRKLRRWRALDAERCVERASPEQFPDARGAPPQAWGESPQQHRRA